MQSFKLDLTKIETDQIHNHFKKFAKYEIQRDKLLLKLEELGEISDDNWRKKIYGDFIEICKNNIKG